MLRMSSKRKGLFWPPATSPLGSLHNLWDRLLCSNLIVGNSSERGSNLPTFHVVKAFCLVHSPLGY